MQQLKTMNIKGKPYVLVNERIKAFREHFQGWSLESEIIELTDKRCVIRAVIRDDQGKTRATGIAYELADSTYINKTSYVENCETSAWGRALGNLGIGVDTSIASAEEVQNAVNNQHELPFPDVDDKISEEQVNRITALVVKLKDGGKSFLAWLNKEYGTDDITALTMQQYVKALGAVSKKLEKEKADEAAYIQKA